MIKGSKHFSTGNVKSSNFRSNTKILLLLLGKKKLKNTNIHYLLDKM